MNPKCKHCSAWNNQTGCQSENPCPISDEPAIKTNGDRVRAMSNEELAESILICPMRLDYECPTEIECKQCKLNWLNSPAESER